jgi:alpha-L-fucosidase
MKKSLSLKKVLCVAMMSSALATNAQNVVVETGSYSPTWESLQAWKCPEWFKNAKFGIWAHWGPQCQAEDGDWYARNMYYEGSDQYKYHVQNYGDPSVFGFKDLCNAWKADQWDPDSLVKLYRSVGARYFFTLGQHHDNFDLWDSPYQEWNSVRVGPKKDIVKGWSDACKKYHLPLGVSMHGSHTWTWMEMSQNYDGNLTKEDGYKLNADGSEKWWKGLDPQELYAQNHETSLGYEVSSTINSQWNWGNGASLPSDTYKQKFQNRVLECINDYNPDMLYFDDTVLPFYGCDESVGLNIVSDFYNHSANKNNGTPNVVVMGKQLDDSQKKSLLWDVERGIPDRTQTEYWQTCTCIGSWHYDKNIYNNNGYKTSQQVVDMLVDIVSKNGNLLLSVPIKGNGTIDDKELKVLDGIKAWMDSNSFSIYGTRPWKTFGEGPLADAANPLSAQGFNESNKYSSDDVRFAQRNDTLFATIMRWPSGSKYTIKSLGYTSDYYSGKVKDVKLLGYGDVKFSMDVDGLVVSLPSEKCNEIAPVFQITFDQNTVDTLSLKQIIDIYNEKIISLRAFVSYNTGKLSSAKLNEFAQKVETAQQYVNANTLVQQTQMQILSEAYEQLKSNGYNQGGQPNLDGCQNLTTDNLVEATHFSRTSDTNDDKRFGSPQNWTVENFKIPNGSDGTKNGIDKFSGENCLMLGVWNDQNSNTEGDLGNARIYKKVHLEAGRYYFGAAYNTTYNMSDRAYIFASDSLISTSDIPEKSIACYNINKSTTTGSFNGIYFTIDQPQDVILGFQADLTSNSTQEFRADAVKLLYYGVMDFNALDDLILTATDYCGETVNTNTGFYKKEAVDKLEAALEEAMKVNENSNSDQILEAYNTLNAAINDFLVNGKNVGGVPSESKNKDITTDFLFEADNFSRVDASVTTRFSSPKNWTVENFKIPNGNSGTKNGIDKYPGYDCLSMGIWDDKQNNEDGDISNARIYRKVHLAPGRYYFGAQYNTTYNLNDKCYLFAASNTMTTNDIPNRSIAYYAINNAGENDGLWHGIFFTLEKEQDVVLGFQADLTNGVNEQEFRAKAVKLLYYGEITYDKVKELVENITDTLQYCKVNKNTGYYSQDAYDKLMTVVNTAKTLTSGASSDEVNDIYSKLTEAYADFLKNGKNVGGQAQKIGATDITVSKLAESSNFTRADQTVTSRFATPLNWAVENFMIPNGSDGVKNGLDKNPGYDCLMLGIWDDRDNNQSGDLSNARIYKTVYLNPGTYYFGAAYNTIYSLYSAYIFASDSLIDTNKMESNSVAYASISKAAADNKFYGIYFTLDEAKDVNLGFQADLSAGSGTQEFRAANVSLISYTTTDGINETETSASEKNMLEGTRYYSIVGIPLQHAPNHGFFIMKQGSKVTKIYRK